MVKNKNSKGGYENTCKSCYNVIRSKYKELKPKKYKSIQKKADKKYRSNPKNKAIIKATNDKWLSNHPEHYKEQYQRGLVSGKPESTKAWRIKNKERIRLYNYEYKKKRIETDPLYYCYSKIRNNITTSLKYKRVNKSIRTHKILGCTIEEFKRYIEDKWEPWMNWGNHGLYDGNLNSGWDLDHIIPISSATTEEELIKLNHHTNFQPLCSYINRYVKRGNIG